MCRILFGADRVGPECFMTSLININSPLTFDATMMGALEVYAAAGQAVIVSPFIVGGAMAPVSVAATLTQVLAEAMVGIAYAQLVNPGCPVIFGAFVTSIDMNSGAPTFGTPEASKILWGAGQLARRMGLPFRSGGALCGSKLPDAQAAYESANTLQAALLGGVNFMLHACGWLEGGLVTSFEKFVLDADQLGVLHSLAEGIDLSENGQAMDAMREVGPGGHFLGCAHTQANFKTAFWRTRGAGLPAVRDLGRGGRARFDAARERADAADAGGVRGAAARSRRRPRRWRTSSRGARRRSRTRSAEAQPPTRFAGDPGADGGGVGGAQARGAGAGADLDADAAERLGGRDGVLVGGVVAEHHRPAVGEGRRAPPSAAGSGPCARRRA